MQVGGKDVLAEDMVEAGVDPVGQRRLLEIADAVDFEGDEVAGFGHVLGGFCVAGVGVVEQRRGEKGGELHSSKNRKQEHPGSPCRRCFDRAGDRS